LSVSQKEMFRSFPYALHFSWGDRFSSRTEKWITAVAYFDKDQGVRIPHQQIDLAGLTAIIALNRKQALFDEMFFC